MGTGTDGDDGAECWRCGARVAVRTIDAETVLRGRPAAEGGPYRVFRCRSCGTENGVLAGPLGGRMLHPLAGLEAPSFLERILSAEERARLARARAWWAANRARVERFRRGLGEPPRRPPPRRAPGPAGRVPAASGPRAVLGVPEDATADEVRRAFRRLAKRHHPDRAAGRADAGERFREIRAAYERVLREIEEA